MRLTDGGEYFTSTDLEGFSPDELVCRYTAGADGGLNEPLMAMTDINGSVVGLVADGGVIQATYAYEPYGATQASGTDDGNSQQFTAREDDGTGVLYYRARYYLPQTGRFINEDPIGFAGGVDLYEYVTSNPITGRDPTGHTGELTLAGTCIEPGGGTLVGAILDTAIWAGGLYCMCHALAQTKQETCTNVGSVDPQPGQPLRKCTYNCPTLGTKVVSTRASSCQRFMDFSG